MEPGDGYGDVLDGCMDDIVNRLSSFLVVPSLTLLKVGGKRR